MKNKWIKRIIIILTFGMIVWLFAGYFSALYLTRTKQVDIPSIVKIEGVPVKTVTIQTEDSLRLSGWYLDNKSKSVVILMSGIQGNRIDQIDRAKLYLKEGFSVLMPDLRGTGESEGNIISFGWNERKDLFACVKYLRGIGYEKIAAHGQSLGAATIVYCTQEFDGFCFVVLESCYDNIENAFRNRVKNYHLPYYCFYPVMFFTEMMMNADVEDLRPEKYICRFNCPVLIMAGDNETQLKSEETKKLYNNLNGIHNEIYFFKGGKHEDLLDRFRLEYLTVWKSFINRLPEI